MRTKSIYIVLITLFCGHVLAAPSITNTSGTFTHDASVTITGTGFGGSDGTPTIWEDWEDGVDGESPSTWTISNPSGDPVAPQYDNSNNRGVSTMCLYNRMHVDYYNEKEVRKTGLSVHNIVYVEGWLYETEPAEASNYQSKLWRLQYTSHTAPVISIFNWSQQNGQEVITRYGEDYQNLGGVEGLSDTNGSWTHHKILIKFGTEGNSDGEARYYLNESMVLFGRSYWLGTDLDALPLLTSGSPSGITELVLRNYVGNRGTMTDTLYFWWDDIYLNDTWQRVEVCNNAAYTSATHCEIQIPTSWNAGGTSITIDVNQGSFAADATAYLFVVDGSNDASTGYEITFGGEGSTPKTLMTGVSISGVSFP